MGFRQIKQQAITCLKQGRYYHEARCAIDVKNRFSTGEVDEAFVVALLSKTRGDGYSCSPHHQDASIDVHVFRTTFSGESWYVKFYMIEPQMIFISVHQSLNGERNEDY